MDMAFSRRAFPLLVMAIAILIPSASATHIPPRSQDILKAIEEMQKANYFAFVMLINMVPADLIQGNVTFLMPNDRALSNADIQENSVEEFLLEYSMPSALLFDHLLHFPTGSLIPTSKPEFFLRVSDGGRSHFFLDNVRIISPNICTARCSIRCHGIDGVLKAAQNNHPPLPSPAHSNTTNSPPSVAAAPAPLWPTLPQPVDGHNLTPMAAPTPFELNPSPHHSNSCPLPYSKNLLNLLATFAALFVLKFSMH